MEQALKDQRDIQGACFPMQIGSNFIAMGDVHHHKNTKSNEGRFFMWRVRFMERLIARA
jgi:hypothetical protein